MKKPMILGIAAIAATGVAGWWAMTTNKDAPPLTSEGAPLVAVTLPASLSAQQGLGETAFNAKCAACHGKNAAGRNGSGPPLVHVIYEPNHHGDYAFEMAAQNGVRSHHWQFGNMPPVEGLTRADVGAIVAYVRVLQRTNGIN